MNLPSKLASKAILALMGLGKTLPRDLALPLFEAGGSLAHLILGRGRRMARHNLHLIYGDRSEANRLSRIVYRELGRNVVDLARLEIISSSELNSLVEVEGYDHLQKAIDRGRGIIGVTGHIGNWELLASWLGCRGVDLTVFSSSSFDPKLGERLVRLRARHGVRSIVRSETDCLREIFRTLHRGGMLGLLMDLRSRSMGVDTVFLGRPARAVTGPVRIAMKTGASLVPMACWRMGDDRYQLVIDEPVRLVSTGNMDADIIENTRRCMQIIETYIHRVRTQWVWMHDRWNQGAA